MFTPLCVQLESPYDVVPMTVGTPLIVWIAGPPESPLHVFCEAVPYENVEVEWRPYLYHWLGQETEPLERAAIDSGETSPVIAAPQMRVGNTASIPTPAISAPNSEVRP